MEEAIIMMAPTVNGKPNVMTSSSNAKNRTPVFVVQSSWALLETSSTLTWKLLTITKHLQHMLVKRLSTIFIEGKLIMMHLFLKIISYNCCFYVIIITLFTILLLLFLLLLLLLLLLLNSIKILLINCIIRSEITNYVSFRCILI